MNDKELAKSLGVGVDTLRILRKRIVNRIDAADLRKEMEVVIKERAKARAIRYAAK